MFHNLITFLLIFSSASVAFGQSPAYDANYELRKALLENQIEILNDATKSLPERRSAINVIVVIATAPKKQSNNGENLTVTGVNALSALTADPGLSTAILPALSKIVQDEDARNNLKTESETVIQKLADVASNPVSGSILRDTAFDSLVSLTKVDIGDKALQLFVAKRWISLADQTDTDSDQRLKIISALEEMAKNRLSRERLGESETKTVIDAITKLANSAQPSKVQSNAINALGIICTSIAPTDILKKSLLHEKIACSSHRLATSPHLDRGQKKASVLILTKKGYLPEQAVQLEAVVVKSSSSEDLRRVAVLGLIGKGNELTDTARKPRDLAEASAKATAEKEKLEKAATTLAEAQDKAKKAAEKAKMAQKEANGNHALNTEIVKQTTAALGKATTALATSDNSTTRDAFNKARDNTAAGEAKRVESEKELSKADGALVKANEKLMSETASVEANKKKIAAQKKIITGVAEELITAGPAGEAAKNALHDVTKRLDKILKGKALAGDPVAHIVTSRAVVAFIDLKSAANAIPDAKPTAGTPAAPAPTVPAPTVPAPTVPAPTVPAGSSLTINASESSVRSALDRLPGVASPPGEE